MHNFYLFALAANRRETASRGFAYGLFGLNFAGDCNNIAKVAVGILDWRHGAGGLGQQAGRAQTCLQIDRAAAVDQGRPWRGYRHAAGGFAIAAGADLGGCADRGGDRAAGAGGFVALAAFAADGCNGDGGAVWGGIRLDLGGGDGDAGCARHRLRRPCRRAGRLGAGNSG